MLLLLCCWGIASTDSCVVIISEQDSRIGSLAGHKSRVLEVVKISYNLGSNCFDLCLVCCQMPYELIGHSCRSKGRYCRFAHRSSLLLHSRLLRIGDQKLETRSATFAFMQNFLVGEYALIFLAVCNNTGFEAVLPPAPSRSRYHFTDLCISVGRMV